MDKLKSIIVNTIYDERIPLEVFNGGKVWYELLAFIEDPDDILHKEEKIIALEKFFPREIEQFDVVPMLFESPVFRNFSKMKFRDIEIERQTAKQRVGNDTCKYCGAKAQAIVYQARSGDEASSVNITCLDIACGKTFKM